MRKFIYILFIVILPHVTLYAFDATKALQEYQVTWDTPGNTALNSMPLGNGDIGLNVWVAENDDILFYISKTDAWSENARLLKLGRVRIQIMPNPFYSDPKFSQTLDVSKGEMTIQLGEKENAARITIRVDANHPVIYVESNAAKDVQVKAAVELWRTFPREIKGDEAHSAYGLNNGPNAIFVEPDTLLDLQKDELGWCHRNSRSIWQANLELQGLDNWVNTGIDPLMNRTFGCRMFGENFLKQDASTLLSSLGKKHCLKIVALTSQTETLTEWNNELETAVNNAKQLNETDTKEQHYSYWQNFWDKSWIFLDGFKESKTITQGYLLQRFINACAGRGNSPIKFNGTIFTVDTYFNGVHYDADFRRWGGPYWWQNTRLPYWSMLYSGDFSLMKPLFDMFLNTLPLAKNRVKTYYHHDGAIYPETMYFWGTYTDSNYGWERENLPLGTTLNQYIRYYWQDGIELVTLMLDYYDMTADKEFLKTYLLPIANEIITFYDQHYQRDENGKLKIWPGQSLETYWDSVNPTPEIAGLGFILPKLYKLKTIDKNFKKLCKKLEKQLPDIPQRIVNGETVIGFAEIPGPKHNQENPELYTIFPYRLYGAEKPDLNYARKTFEHRIHKGTGGWYQTPIQAALLGLVSEAESMVVKNFTTKDDRYRFPAFWGPNYDWTPDQDHGSVSMIALQRMILQTDDGKILLFPAWPKDWNVEFKLHGPEQTIIQGSFINGQVENLIVTPENRKKDVIIMTEHDSANQ